MDKKKEKNKEKNQIYGWRDETNETRGVRLQISFCEVSVENYVSPCTGIFNFVLCRR